MASTYVKLFKQGAKCDREMRQTDRVTEKCVGKCEIACIAGAIPPKYCMKIVRCYFEVDIKL